MKKEKVYKRRIYWFNTTKACGAVAVDQDGLVYKLDTAPIFKWMSGKRFVEIKKFLQQKNQFIGCKLITTEVDPF
ncbi:MAG: hypothetical protein K9L62_10515 [Vallitaleaceae bacterium]|jgi:hypothetical protein|nr:hypothetical protein [Vallitaleaceae bacterium]